MSTNIADLFGEVANIHNIHPAEAIDEVFDAIEVLWPRESRPENTLTSEQRTEILRYIAEQYRTNRTRL